MTHVTLHIRSHGVSAVLSHQANAEPRVQWATSCVYAGRIVWGFGRTDLLAITDLVSQLPVVRS